MAGKGYCTPITRVLGIKPRLLRSEKSDFGAGIKAAALRASPSVVNILRRNVRDGVPLDESCKRLKLDPGELVLSGTGIIIECEHAGDCRYVSTILAPATLFGQTGGVRLNEIKVDVNLSDGKLYKGEVLACDVHYNLAAIRIQSDLPLRTALLRGLDDITSIDPNEHLQLCTEKFFQLRPHTNLFKILSGTKIIILMRSLEPPYELVLNSGVFCTDASACYDCKELCWVQDIKFRGDSGGAVINCSGEVIGIMFKDTPFLPSNFISRWWNYYKSNREFNRPWLGIDVANLHAVRLGFLEELRRKFPNISAGIVVTEVEKDTPAYHSGIRPKDVIVKCASKLVRSKIEFFEIIWDNAKKSVELDILRESDGCQLNLSLAIGKTTSDKFYRWPLPTSKSIRTASEVHRDAQLTYDQSCEGMESDR